VREFTPIAPTLNALREQVQKDALTKFTVHTPKALCERVAPFTVLERISFLTERCQVQIVLCCSR